MGYMSVEITFRMYKSSLDRRRLMESPDIPMITEEARLCLHPELNI